MATGMFSSYSKMECLGVGSLPRSKEKKVLALVAPGSITGAVILTVYDQANQS